MYQPKRSISSHWYHSVCYNILSRAWYPTAFRRNDERTCSRNCRCTRSECNAKSSWNNYNYNYNSNNKNTHHRRRPTTISTKYATTIARSNPYLNNKNNRWRAIKEEDTPTTTPGRSRSSCSNDRLLSVLPVLVCGSNWNKRQRSFANQRKHPR